MHSSADDLPSSINLQGLQGSLAQVEGSSRCGAQAQGVVHATEHAPMDVSVRHGCTGRANPLMLDNYLTLMA